MKKLKSRFSAHTQKFYLILLDRIEKALILSSDEDDFVPLKRKNKSSAGESSKKRSSDEEDFIQIKRKPKSSSSETTRKRKAVKFDLNLSSSDVPLAKPTLEPYSIYIGSDIVLEVKPFKKEYYLGFYKNVDGNITNRFNINIKQIQTVRKAIETIMEYCRVNDFKI